MTAQHLFLETGMKLRCTSTVLERTSIVFLWDAISSAQAVELLIMKSLLLLRINSEQNTEIRLRLDTMVYCLLQLDSQAEAGLSTSVCWEVVISKVVQMRTVSTTTSL